MLIKKTALLKKLPDEVKTIFAAFLQDGDEIKLVGGAVRDLLIGKAVKDFDFATKFLPEQIIKILEKNKIKAIPTGLKHGTVTASINHKNFEITTLRKDVKTDGRRAEVEFVDDYFFDAARRDFTMNALYLDSKGVVQDYFNGIYDLKNRNVRFIGDADVRIKEDFLRILRFFRFSLEYADELDNKGLKACAKNKKNLKTLSRERIRDEFFKIISSKNKDGLIATLQEMQKQGILAEIFDEELNLKALERLFAVEKKLEIVADLDLKIAVLFKDGLLRRCASRNDEASLNSTLPASLRGAQRRGNPSLSANFVQFFNEICATNLQKKYFKFLFEAQNNLSSYDLKLLLLKNPKNWVRDFYILNLLQKSRLANLSQIKLDLEFIQNFSAPKFPLNGDDLMKLGYKEKMIGMAIKKAQDLWVKSDFKLKKADLLKFLTNKQ